MISDEFIINTFICNKKLNNNYRKKMTSEIKEYLINRYSDTSNEIESIIRIYLKINKHPLCPICGKPVIFYRSVIKPFGKTCSTSCSAKLASTYVNIDKRNKAIKEGVKNKYGVENVFQLENVKEKSKKTKIEKYGDENFNNREKERQTKIIHYGGPSYFEDSELRKKSIEKKHNTVKDKYGVDNVFQSEEIKEKCKKTILERYGVDNAGKIEFLKEIRKQHEYETKKKNNSFNKSKPEDESYSLLKELYPNAIRQYKSKLYPFSCDFYIPNYNDNIIDSGLYIECNYHWTHNNHLYNKNNKKDQLIVEQWKEKNTKYYNNAINTWTKLDLKKYNIAKKNKLNYLIFYKFNDFINWIKKKSST